MLGCMSIQTYVIPFVTITLRDFALAPLSSEALAYARKVPQRGTVRTSPSAARTRSTLVIVAWET